MSIPPMQQYYVGTHHVSHLRTLHHAMLSVNALADRRSPFQANHWILDSGAFSQLLTRGEHTPVTDYADHVMRWSGCGTFEAAVCQDYMCEPFVLERTGRTVAEHQAMTIERYEELLGLVGAVYVMPVLQGYEPEQYADHVRQYGSLLHDGQWVGVGSVCKRNARPEQVRAVLAAIKAERPDLRLHAFGLKLTALTDGYVRMMLHSADSMAWSFAARRQGRDANSVREAIAFGHRMRVLPYQLPLSPTFMGLQL